MMSLSISYSLSEKGKLLEAINIGCFNKARNYALLRRYYLIATREALDLKKHAWVEDIYKIPQRKENTAHVFGPLSETTA